MAIPIKSIPELRGQATVYFVNTVVESGARRHSIDFAKQSVTMERILVKAKLK